ncbi:glycoside hydrolase family 3 protein [Selenomonas sp. AB3002]|uniref:glycoside hydrolase family 3 protein n=1 Tax=Selenomonas sp. AB3002 TaxID=1392502 RepID=UPI000497FC5F
MKRKLIVGISVAIIFLIAIVSGSLYVMNHREATAQTASSKQEQKTENNKEQQKLLTTDEQVEDILSRMSLTEKIGQLMMVSLPGTEVDDEARYALHQFHYGGIVLFDRNFESKEQVKNFVLDVQSGAGEKVPLFVAIDEEGGLVSRGKEVIPPPPSAEAVGKENKEFARKLASAVAGDLREIGVNVNFAPVADLGLGRERSYSTSPYEVLKFVQAVGEGYHEKGLIYTLKHFPGIGKGTVDSHEDFSSIEATEHELRKEDLVPFRETINGTDKGRPMDYMIMVGHFRYPAFDTENPASLSAKIITGLLRKDLGYEGLIITDDLGMGAIIKQYTFGEAAVKAFQAGSDLILVCHDYGHAEEAYMGILNAVKEGKISEKRVDESVRRIIKAKFRHGLKPVQ